MPKYACLNNIAEVGLKRFHAGFEPTDDVNEADGLLVLPGFMTWSSATSFLRLPVPVPA